MSLRSASALWHPLQQTLLCLLVRGVRGYQLLPVLHVKAIRRLAGLSRYELAAALHVSERAVISWEDGWASEKRGQAMAWLLYLAYFQPHPTDGWRRAALGLPPSGRLSPELAQLLAQPQERTVQVSGYKRRERWDYSLRETNKAKAGFVKQRKPRRVKTPDWWTDGTDEWSDEE